MTIQTTPALHLDHPIYYVYYIYLAPPAELSIPYSPPSQTYPHPTPTATPHLPPHLSAAIQTTPALDLEHPIYHVYHVHLAPPSYPPAELSIPYPPPSGLSQTFADYILDLLHLLDLYS